MWRGAVLAFVLFAGVARTSDWPQFRGPNSTGVAERADLPDRWGPDENVRWKTALPGRGVSSPVVVGDRIYLTACSGMNETHLHVLCIATETGARLWERQFWATGSTNCNPKTCMAAPTPAAGPRGVFALFATGDLVYLDPAGNLRWLRTMQIEQPAMSNLVGRGASPVLAGDVLVVPMESQGASFLFGIDAETGRNRWKVERPIENNYTTPLLLRQYSRTDLVVQAAGGLTGYDPLTGAKRWQVDDENLSAVASPLAADGLVLATGRETVALRLADARSPEVSWRSARLATSTSTPLAAAGRLYVVKDNGILVAAELRTGKELWTQRLRGTFSASPVFADGKLYLVNEDGETAVVRAGSTAERIATNPLDGPMLATPAIACGCLFLRSDRWLYCVGRQTGAK
jgi:outer membrane protein assembly factor BamB